MLQHIIITDNVNYNFRLQNTKIQIKNHASCTLNCNKWQNNVKISNCKLNTCRISIRKVHYDSISLSWRSKHECL